MKNLTLLKQTLTFSFIGASVLLTPVAAPALTVEEVTNPRQNNGGWVSDLADILSNSTEAELNSLITNLEQNNGTEIAVVTVSETAPAESPKAFATELFNHWGIGKAELDNGILFLVSMGDKRVEIETGYGIENVLTDAEVARVIDTQITPQYKQGNYDRGTLDGTKALISSLQSPANIRELILNIGNKIQAGWLYVQTIMQPISLMLAVFIILVIANNQRRIESNSSSQNHHTGCDDNSSSDGGSFFSSGSSSSDSGGFGGGSSDGGGDGGDF